MKKIKILLACVGGFSTSMLVKRLIAEGEKDGYEVDCHANAVETLLRQNEPCDLILVGPQAGYFLKTINEKMPDTPAVVINYQDYGMMNAAKVWKMVLSAMEKGGAKQ